MLTGKKREKVYEKEKKSAFHFKNGSRLIIDQGHSKESVQLISKLGQIQIIIEMTDVGSKIELSGDVVKLTAKEMFEIESPIIKLSAKDSMSLKSEGNLHTNVKRDHFSVARIQNITADLGNVNIKANDDVRLDGERVKLNCTD